MPNVREDELLEFPFVGPFGGIQSEVSPVQISQSGFVELQNLICRLSRLQTVPGFVPISSPDVSTILGIADFYNINGVRRAVVWTAGGHMYYWNPGTGLWVQVTGTLTGSATQFFQWDIIGYKLYFSQQKDVVQVWDGISAGFAAASGSAVPAKYLCELNMHLLAANTIEAGPANAPNRIHWSGAGDGTDWTSFNSGQTDLFNSLGPVNGLAKLYQAGFAFQQWGITQIIPTGIGVAPFAFVPLGSRSKGSILPYGLASFGEQISVYIGKDDIYLFDGTQSVGIGSRPVDGNRRLGARVRIFSDLYLANQSNIFGYIMSSANGFEYESYWLIIPSLNKAWIYHFDEGNWTQLYFIPGVLNGPVGNFPVAQISTIQQLSGSILSQSWTPAGISNSSTLDTMALSTTPTSPTIAQLGGTIAQQAWTPAQYAPSLAYFSFGSPTNQPTFGSITSVDGWYLKTGPLNFDDSRHLHSVRKVRLVLEDSGAMTINIRLSNEYGKQQSQTISVGTGSGAPITKVVEFQLTGKYITLELSGPPNTNVGIVEIAPIYDIGGEVPCG